MKDASEVLLMVDDSKSCFIIWWEHGLPRDSLIKILFHNQSLKFS